MIDSFFNPEIIAQVLPSIISGVWITLALSITVILSGTTLGLALATIRAFQKKPVNFLIVLFVEHLVERLVRCEYGSRYSSGGRRQQHGLLEVGFIGEVRQVGHFGDQRVRPATPRGRPRRPTTRARTTRRSPPRPTPPPTSAPEKNSSTAWFPASSDPSALPPGNIIFA